MERVNFPLKQDKIRTLVSTLTSEEIAYHLHLGCFVEEALLYAFDDEYRIEIKRRETSRGDLFEIETATGESHFHYLGHAFKEYEDGEDTKYAIFWGSRWIEIENVGSPFFARVRSRGGIESMIYLIEQWHEHYFDFDYEARR